MKKSYILIIIFIIFVIFITVIGSAIITGNVKIDGEKDILAVQTNKEAYFNCYGYTVDNPNIIVNPYGNSPLTAIVMFTTDGYSEVSIKVLSKDGNSDINYTFSKDKYHLIPIYGLYADYDNKVVISSEGKVNTINIKTDKLPDDFEFTSEECNSNFTFYNTNYPYAVDANNEVRWYFNRHYYGNITVLDNSTIVIGSDKYTEDGNSISFYKISMLGKIYNEYLLSDSYYGFNAKYNDGLLVLSDKLLLIDFQTGEIIREYARNDSYDYLNVDGDDIIVGKNGEYLKVLEDEIEEASYTLMNNVYNFYNNTSNYKIVPSNRFGNLKETSLSDKSVFLLHYKKGMPEGISLYQEVNRLAIYNESDDIVYIILDKFLDKRIYEVNDIKYINISGLSGKYTVYFKVKDNIYKTDYYIEV